MYEMTLTTRGYEEQIALLEGMDKLIVKNFEPQFLKSVIVIESRVKPAIPVGVSGETRRSVTHRVTSNVKSVLGSDLIKGVVGSKMSGPRPVVIELGRKAPGKMPPPGALIRWVELKLRIRGKRARGVAFVIARNIAKRGFSPRGDVGPRGTRAYEKGFKKSIPQINTFMQLGAKNLLDDLTVKESDGTVRLD